jgi:hypothetical protein
VNKAGPEHRQDLREYAMDLLRDGTEAVDVPAARPAAARRTASQNPLGLGLLLGVVGVPLAFVFPPFGIGLVAVAAVMCVVGIGMIVIRR